MLKGLKELSGVIRRIRTMSANNPLDTGRANKSLRVIKHAESLVSKVEQNYDDISYRDVHEIERELDSLKTPHISPEDMPSLFDDMNGDDEDF